MWHPKEWAETAVPGWFSRGRARVAYGDLGGAQEMRGVFERARVAGLDAVLASVDDGVVRGYTAGDADGIVATAAAQANGIPFFLGSFYRNRVFEARRDELGTAVDAFGRVLDAPPPTHPGWWAEGVAPIVMGAARAAADHPGLTGVSLDTELYGSGSLSYHAGHAFDPTSWGLVVEAIGGHDPDLASAAGDLEVTDRLRWLVDRGLLGFAWRTLEGAVAAEAAAIRDAARAVAPDLEFVFYAASVRTSWFYLGLMRGWGTSDRPVLVLSYDAGTGRLRDALAAEGVHARILGGVVAVRLTAADLEVALREAGARTDGFWLFQYRDFDPARDPAELHDPPDAYWEATRRAGESLSAPEGDSR